MSEAAADNLLAEQFDDIEQQRSAAILGMWIFLATEVLFFGGLFLSYTVYRYLYPDVWAAASRHTEVVLGGANTAVLLFSSTLMALAVSGGRQRTIEGWVEKNRPGTPAADAAGRYRSAGTPGEDGENAGGAP